MNVCARNQRENSRSNWFINQWRHKKIAVWFSFVFKSQKNCVARMWFLDFSVILQGEKEDLQQTLNIDEGENKKSELFIIDRYWNFCATQFFMHNQSYFFVVILIAQKCFVFDENTSLTCSVVQILLQSILIWNQCGSRKPFEHEINRISKFNVHLRLSNVVLSVRQMLTNDH